MHCLARAQSALSSQVEDEVDRWTQYSPGAPLVCSYCGSVEPSVFVAAVSAGRELVPTDKSYKAYINLQGGEAKFYFWHLSPGDERVLSEMLQAQRVRFAHPGRFYVRPAFLAVGIAPPFSFGAIVKLVRSTDDGEVITLVDPLYRHLVERLAANPELMHEISPRKWEEIIAAAYDRAGFDEVILTPRSGDLGRDVIAIKHGFGSVKFIEQVKAYKPGHRVTADDVRSLLGVLHAERDATKAIFTTTSEFAPGIQSDRLIAPYLPFRLELVEKTGLLRRLVTLEAGSQ